MEVYILSGARTPSGTFLNEFQNVSAPQLGSVAIQGAFKRTDADAKDVDEVFMGNVISAGVGQAPARQAAIFSGLSESVPCTTINKVCGSGLMSIILGAQTIMINENDMVVCGGMESMSRAPHILDQSRSGIKFGDTKLKDSMIIDGLKDVYTSRPMGNCAEECVTKYDFTREQMDDFSERSFKRAQKATEDGIFESEIEPVFIKMRKKDITIKRDEGVFKANFEKMRTLKPAFENEGKITAGNASTLNDGAAALVLGSKKYIDQAKFKIISYSKHAQNPTWFTTAPVEAMKKNLEKSNLTINDIDLFEINEAFAVVPMAAIKEFGLDESKVNIYGGGVSLGHPLGCSGARIIVTLMTGLEKNNLKRGMASICIGGGEALSIIIERL